jgi:hypothetical protein
MKIAVISDTHLAHPTEGFKRHMKTLFGDVDIVLHAGDMTSSSVFDYLSNWDLRAVRGNMDDFDLAARLPESRVEEIAGRRIGIIHGWGSPRGSRTRFSAHSRVWISSFSAIPTFPSTQRKGSYPLQPRKLQERVLSDRTVGIIEIAAEVTCGTFRSTSINHSEL